MGSQEEREEWEMVELAMSPTATGEAECLDPTYAEAKRRPDWPKWQAAIQAELDSLIANGNWELIARPTDGSNVVDSKWVLLVSVPEVLALAKTLVRTAKTSGAFRARQGPS